MIASSAKIHRGMDTEPGREGLEHDGHQIGQQDDREQRVAELRTAGDVGRPIAGIHIADGDQIARTDKGQKAAERRHSATYGNRAENLGKGRSVALLAPGF